MRHVIESIEAGKVSAELRRRGVPATQLVRVIVETLDGDLPQARIAEEGRAFTYLGDEPDLYSEADILKP